MSSLLSRVRSQVSQYLKLIGENRHGSRTLWDSAISIVIRAIAGVANLVFIMVMARFLGSGSMGLLFLALAVITVSSIVGRLGMDNAVLRFVAESASRNEWQNISSLYRKSLTLAIVVSISVILILYLSSPWLSLFVFSKPELSPPLRIMIFSILPLSVLYLHAEMLKGLRKVWQALLLEGVFVPLIAIMLVLVVWLVQESSGRASNITYAAMMYFAATVVSAFIAVFLWYRETPKLVAVARAFSTSALIRTSMPMLWIAIMNMAMGWTGIFMLGILMNKEAVGRYAVASRLAMLTSFILMAVNNVLAPRFAVLYAAGNYDHLRNLARNSAKITTVLAVPVTLLFVLFPEHVLALFGRGFAAAGPALAILAFGQFVNVATGSVGYLLMMSGHEKDYRNNLVIVALLNVVMNWILIPIYGTTGAATATAVSVITLNIISAVLVYRRLSIMVVPFPRIFRRSNAK